MVAILQLQYRDRARWRYQVQLSPLPCTPITTTIFLGRFVQKFLQLWVFQQPTETCVIIWDSTSVTKRWIIWLTVLVSFELRRRQRICKQSNLPIVTLWTDEVHASTLAGQCNCVPLQLLLLNTIPALRSPHWRCPKHLVSGPRQEVASISFCQREGYPALLSMIRNL